MKAIGMLVLFLATCVAFGWRWAQRDTSEPAPMADKLIFTSLIIFQILISVPMLGPFAPFLIVGYGVMLSLLWTPTLFGTMLSPLTGIFDGGGQRVEARAKLSSVHAKRMQGRYDEAIEDVREQLEEFPGDFDAQMLLAELLVDYKKDFDAGMEVLEEIIGGKHTPQQIAGALNAMADWQIKHRSDPGAARAALQRIVDAFPDDALSAKATQRIIHLPTREEIDRRSQPRIHTVEHVEDYIQQGGRKTTLGVAKEASPVQRADALTGRLNQFPQDTEAREQLALIYADELGQIEWAADQIEMLVRMPHQSDREKIRWLEMLADLHRRHGDKAGTQRCYQRIVDSFPSHPGAERARYQLAVMGDVRRGN